MQSITLAAAYSPNTFTRTSSCPLTSKQQITGALCVLRELRSPSLTCRCSKWQSVSLRETHPLDVRSQPNTFSHFCSRENMPVYQSSSYSFGATSPGVARSSSYAPTMSRSASRSMANTGGVYKSPSVRTASPGESLHSYSAGRIPLRTADTLLPIAFLARRKRTTQTKGLCGKKTKFLLCPLAAKRHFDSHSAVTATFLLVVVPKRAKRVLALWIMC